jgi:hypothetical protein
MGSRNWKPAPDVMTSGASDTLLPLMPLTPHIDAVPGRQC